MNEIVTPKQPQQQQPQQSQSPLKISLQIPEIKVNPHALTRLLFAKLQALEERIQHLEQTQQNRTHQ